MKKISILCVTIFLCYSSTALARIKCPPAELIKSSEFIIAIQNKFDPDCWDFDSLPISFGNKVWTVSFGTFFPGVTDKYEALAKAKEYFQTAKIVIQHPNPVRIPNYLFCDYMPTGREFWLAATTPFLGIK